MAQPTNNNQIEIKQLSVVLKRRKILSDITISFAGPGIRSQLSHDEVVNVLKRVGLAADKKPVASYSLGMIQRLGIAQAIMEDQDVILLDEPTNALDKDGVKMLTGLLTDLRQQGKLVLIASHDLAWLYSLADHSYELTDGQLKPVEEANV